MSANSDQQQQRLEASLASSSPCQAPHRLTGEPHHFAQLELVDPGEPKTTDLDAALGCDGGDPASRSLLSEGGGGRNLSPDEDLITVKYLPIKMSLNQEANEEDDYETDADGAQGKREEPEVTTSASQRSELRGGLDAEAKVRIVEHIRKNLTLFESQRQVYQVCPPYVNQENHNRGHLQSLLVQKQQQQPTRGVHFSQRPPTRAVDQYTQYRASDLVSSAATNSQKEAYQRNSYSRGPPTRPQLEQLIHNGRGKSRSLQKSATVARRNGESGTKRSASLKRSVSSLNELLKRPLGRFVARRAKVPTNQHHQQVKQTQEGKREEEEDFYKVPVTRQLYASSQQLYLTPAPDYTVHIATRLVKDIILAHQRHLDKQKQEAAVAQQQQVQSKLNQFLSGTSYSFRRSRKSTSKDTTHLEPASLIRAKVRMPSNKSDKAIISDNKDGTIKISYEPKEVGQHEIALRYQDEPIDESPIVFYVDAVGSAKKKITAYGSGLSHGSVGSTCKFTINTGGLGSAKLQATVEGPSRTQVSLQDNKDGTIGVSYSPQAPGDYKIKLAFDGKQVVGSPFCATISDEGRQRSRLSVGRGSEHTLEGNLKVSEDDLKTLNAVLVTPCGLEEPCGLKLLPSGQLAIVFTPREQGDHSVSVKRRGNHISGSPFKFDVLSRDIGDAKQVKVSGKNLKEGKAGADNELVINTREAGYGGLSVALEGPGRSEISTSKESPGADGTIKLSYRPQEPGLYSLIVKYADHLVPGSPFSIKVGGQGTNPQKEVLKKFRRQVEVAEVDSECHFTFKLPGVSAYDLSARIHSPHGQVEDASIKDKGDFVYQVSFTPKELGAYSLSIRNKDIHTDGSPFPFTVGPLLDFGPHKVRCGGPGLIRGICQKWNEFNVFTREAGAGELLVIVEGPSKPELSYTDRKDGSCHVGYKVGEPGEYRISVLFNEHEVPDSPFRAYIMPCKGDVAKIELGPMPPENMIQLNKPCNMTVIMNGAKGNIEGQVILPSGKREDCFASPIDAENWGVRFIPRELGIHQVHIKFNKGSSHIPQSPIFIRVGHDKADPASVVAHGHGLKAALVNHATDFTIETCNAGHALLDVNIEGPTRVSMSCAEIDEGYKIDYTPLAPGDYLISIKYNGCHIGSSPYKVRAIKQAGERSVADVGSHEVASISVATTDREAKQKVENMPKFKSDATRVYCKGMGLKKAFAGKPNTLTVNCSEAGFNMIYASFLGPTRNTIHECSVKHMGGSIFEVKYTCKDRGDAILVVKYGDEQIPGSPFRLECV